MKYNSGIQIPASKAIQHMRLRLSAEQVSSIDAQKRTYANSEKLIEHMRSRLNASSRQSYRNVFSP